MWRGAGDWESPGTGTACLGMSLGCFQCMSWTRAKHSPAPAILLPAPARDCVLLDRDPGRAAGRPVPCHAVLNVPVPAHEWRTRRQVESVLQDRLALSKCWARELESSPGPRHCPGNLRNVAAGCAQGPKPPPSPRMLGGGTPQSPEGLPTPPDLSAAKASMGTGFSWYSRQPCEAAGAMALLVLLPHQPHRLCLLQWKKRAPASQDRAPRQGLQPSWASTAPAVCCRGSQLCQQEVPRTQQGCWLPRAAQSLSAL